VAAIRARQLGAEVTLVEMDHLGGTCTNRGCIPSKAMLRCAEMAREARELDQYGVDVEFKGVNWSKVVQRKDQVVGQLRKGVEFLVKEHGIRLVRGKGRLAEPLVVEVETEGKTETIKADRVLLAVGSTPARLPLPGFDLPGVLNSDQILDIGQLPESIAIIGAGPIGVEFADVFNSMGSKVTVIELLPRLVPLEDEEISAELGRVFRRRRIDVFLNTKVLGVVERDGKRVVQFEHEGKAAEVGAEVVLSAVGRWPNTDGISLPEAGVEMNRRAIKANARMETNVPGVYAAGDATGGILLAHVAFQEGKVAVANALGRNKEMDYRAIPSVTYTHPEIGSTGLTEAQAKKRGVDVKVGRFYFRAAGRAVAEGHREGMAKIVVDAATGKVIGGHVIGPRATDLIQEVVLAVQLGVSAEDLGELVHGHPTLSEAIKEAAEDALGVAIHK
jgi:dihydrolipoamide dehydrogenase